MIRMCEIFIEIQKVTLNGSLRECFCLLPLFHGDSNDSSQMSYKGIVQHKVQIETGLNTSPVECQF